MKKIIVARNNKHKIQEIKEILKEYNVVSLKEERIDIDPEENGTTFIENAYIKAKAGGKTLTQQQEEYELSKAKEELDETGDSANGLEDDLNGLGDTMEEVSDRFGTSSSAINESLASIGIDGNKIALQLDAVQAMFDEKFNMVSANAREYLDAVAEGNQDVLNEMSGDADKYLGEIKSAFNDMSLEEQAIFYSTYGEINGVTDGWLDYTSGSYEE